jgi:hypothetical protein
MTSTEYLPGPPALHGIKLQVTLIPLYIHYPPLCFDQRHHFEAVMRLFTLAVALAVAVAGTARPIDDPAPPAFINMTAQEPRNMTDQDPGNSGSTNLPNYNIVSRPASRQLDPDMSSSSSTQSPTK